MGPASAAISRQEPNEATDRNRAMAIHKSSTDNAPRLGDADISGDERTAAEYRLATVRGSEAALPTAGKAAVEPPSS